MNKTAAFLGWIRDLKTYLEQGGEFSKEYAEAVEAYQDQVRATFDRYQAKPTQDTTKVLHRLLLEALDLILDGLDDFLDYEEELQSHFLETGLAKIEEGNDVLDSLRYALEQDFSWTSASALS